MTNDINTAIDSVGYVTVPEKAVGGTGRSAINVYSTYNDSTGSQGWKIGGRWNGVFTAGFSIVLSTSLLLGALITAIFTVGSALLTIILITNLSAFTLYLSFFICLAWI